MVVHRHTDISHSHWLRDDLYEYNNNFVYLEKHQNACL